MHDLGRSAPALGRALLEEVNLLLGYAQWGSLIACAAWALVSGGLMAVGHLSSRPDASDKGKRALLWSLGGVAVVALAIPTLNTVFSAVS